MDREARIEALVKTPPKVVLTPWQKFERGLAWLTTVVAIVALILGVVSIESTAQQARCTNSALKARADASTQQLMAARDFAKVDKQYFSVLNDLLFIHPPKTKAEMAAAKKLFQRVQGHKLDSATAWYNELNAIISISKRVPLGKC